MRDRNGSQPSEFPASAIGSWKREAVRDTEYNGTYDVVAATTVAPGRG